MDFIVTIFSIIALLYFTKQDIYLFLKDILN